VIITPAAPDEQACVQQRDSDIIEKEQVD